MGRAAASLGFGGGFQLPSTPPKQGGSHSLFTLLPFYSIPPTFGHTWSQGEGAPLNLSLCLENRAKDTTLLEMALVM